MGNSTSSATITVICSKSQREMISTTPSKQYQKRITCTKCSVSIAPQEVLFHCNHCNPKSEPRHKGRYDLCESCSKQRALKVLCTKCKNVRLEKIAITTKHNYLECSRCKGQIVKNAQNRFIYQCARCQQCTVCMKCVKHPPSKQNGKMNALGAVTAVSNFNPGSKTSKFQSNGSNQRRVRTTLHGYDMIGPYTPHKNMVWYCDNKTCRYTKHGLYRKYRIENWRSTKFGKKFTLCDGCVRQYEQQQPVYIVQPPTVHVQVDMNMPQPSAPMAPMQNSGINGINGMNGSHHLRSDTEIIQYQPEGVTQTGTQTRSATTFM